MFEWPIRSLRPRVATAALGVSFFATSIFATSIAGAGDSAGAPLRSITLSEALAYAAAHQPQILASQARIAAAKTEAKVPRAQWLPTVGVAAELVIGTTNNSTATPVGSGVLDLPRIGGTKVSASSSFAPSPTTLVGVGVGQEIFDFGRIAAQTAALDAAVAVEEHGAHGTALDVAFGVESAYFAVQAARAVVAAAEGAFTRATAHRDLARAGVGSGLRPPLELTRAEADRMRFDVGRIRARGGLAAAQAELAAAVGVTEAALDAADEPAPSRAAAPPVDAAVRDAMAGDPAILEARARVKEQEARTRAIRAETRPNVWLSGTFSGRNGGAAPSSGTSPYGGGWIPSVPNWDVGVVLSWKLFDGSTRARADASQAREQVRRAEVDSVRQREVAQVQRASIAEEIARNTLPALERARTAAVANYAQVEARFKAGLATGVELADAEALRTEAEIQEALGRFEAARTRSALTRSIGQGPGSEQRK